MFKNKKIAIIGFGKEGVASANYLAGKNQVTIIDSQSENKIPKLIKNKLNTQNISIFFKNQIPQTKFDIVVRSPGVRPDAEIIKQLKTGGAQITTSTNIFFQECPAKIVGVTGTKGKGTTSTLIYEIAKEAGLDVFLAGNIGLPTLEILPKVKADSLVVLELSSFQLMDLNHSPHIAVVLMITSEHLDWHSSTQEYQVAKEAIVKYQLENDFAVINNDFEMSRKFAKHSKGKVYLFSTKGKVDGAYLEGANLVSSVGTKEIVTNTKNVALIGPHNLQNILAAAVVSKIVNIETKVITSVIAKFKGLKHRLQFAGKINGASYYNDSFSTTPETTMAAIDSFAEPEILILGGSSKKSNFTSLAQKIVNEQKIKAVILIGQESTRLERAIAKAGPFSGIIKRGANNIKEIVSQAEELTSTGDVVIFSPACASFDMFKNYEDRGNQFIAEVFRRSK